jgi:peroxiredoxin
MTSSTMPRSFPQKTRKFSSCIQDLPPIWINAKEFLEKQAELPANIVLVTDPDYTVTNRYGLRWDAPHETAYPSTFVLDKKGVVVFEKISHSHGDRLSAEDALDHLPAR